MCTNFQNIFTSGEPQLKFFFHILVGDSQRMYLAAFNHTCNEIGHEHLRTDMECIKAVEVIKEQSKVFLTIPNSIGETDEGYPKGCYVNDGVVWFNNHPIGSREQHSQPICKGLETGKYTM